MRAACVHRGDVSATWKQQVAKSLTVVFSVCFLAGILSAQKVAITTHHYDNFRTGWNNHETILNSDNVASDSFGMLFSVPVDSQVDAQPLIVPHVTITAGNHQGTHDVVYIATENNTIYAIDANSGQLLLNPNLGPPMIAPANCQVNPTVGVNSTPVIDLTTNTLYVVALSTESGTPQYHVHALDLGSLTDKIAPVLVSASHLLSDGSSTSFNASVERQRPALLLANGNIYAAFGSFCDKNVDVSRGWLLGWQANTLTPLPGSTVFDTQASSPSNYFLASIWMSGWGPAADANGNIYVITGNSDPLGQSYDGVTDIQESVVKVSPDLTRVVDLFTPSDWSTLDQTDRDFGSGGVTLLPPKPTSAIVPQKSLALAAGKEGNMFLMDQDNLGGYSPNGNNVLGTFSIGRCFSGASYFVDAKDRMPVVVASGGSIVGLWKFAYNPGLTLNNIANSDTLFQNANGFFTTVSSNGYKNPLIWALGKNQPKVQDLILYALDPEQGEGTIEKVFSTTTPGIWPYSGKANLVPVVANGKVYVASGQLLTVFGLDNRKRSHQEQQSKLPQRRQ